jgi:uncharacterized membrane protein YagU involved in acid resistance
MQSIPPVVRFAFRRPSGIIAGLTAAWAIFGFILAIDSELGLPPGTFYKMIGIAFGVFSSYAVYVGFILHMITGVIIGIVYSTLSQNIKKFHITSIQKGLGTGILTGVVVWVILFLPLNYGIMQPTLHNMTNTLDATSPEYLMAVQLLALSNTIVFGSLVLHVVFGGVMGFCARLAVV